MTDDEIDRLIARPNRLGIATYVTERIGPAVNRVRQLRYALRYCADDEQSAALSCELETALAAVGDLYRLAELVLGRPLGATIH